MAKDRLDEQVDLAAERAQRESKGKNWEARHVAGRRSLPGAASTARRLRLRPRTGSSGGGARCRRGRWRRWRRRTPGQGFARTPERRPAGEYSSPGGAQRGARLVEIDEPEPDAG